MNINLTDQSNITLSLTVEQLNEFANQLLEGARLIYERKEVPEQYLTRKQAAELLDVNLTTLWRWNNEKYLCPVVVGANRCRYRLSDIERILKGKGDNHV